MIIVNGDRSDPHSNGSALCARRGRDQRTGGAENCFFLLVVKEWVHFLL